jgi:hypothetical protein
MQMCDLPEKGEGGEARKPAALSYEAISNAFLRFQNKV